MAKPARHPADPAGQKFIADKRAKDAERKAAEVEAREKLVAEANAPADHPDVAVVKRDERAARAEQERLDIAKAAAAGQKPEAPPEPPPEAGILPSEFAPAHPDEPGPEGSAPFDPTTPAGPMGEDVIHRTADIKPDGTPEVQPGDAPLVPEYDGQRDKDIPIGEIDVKLEDEAPLINRHSEEGARLDALKTGRKVVYVPTDAALDPVANKPDRRD